MTLQTKTLAFPLASGVEEGVDPLTARPGTLKLLKNAAWTKDGKLEKRHGLVQLSGSGAPGSVKRLIVRGQELSATDGASIYTYSPTVASWTNAGKLPEMSVLTRPLTAPLDGIQASDAVLLNNGLLVHAWVVGNPVSASVSKSAFFEVIDPQTGERTTAATRILANVSARVRVVTDGTNYIVLIHDSGANAINAYVNGSTSGTTLVSNAVNGGTFDAFVVGSVFVLAYEKTSGTNRIILESFTFASTPASSVGPVAVANETQTGFSGISIAGNPGEMLYVAYCWKYDGSTSKVRVAGQDPVALTQTLAPVTLDATSGTNWAVVGVARLDSTHAVVAYSGSGTNVEYAYGRVNTKIVKSDGTLTFERGTRTGRLLSRPFLLNSIPYMLITDDIVVGASFSGKVNALPAATGLNAYLVAIQTSVASIGFPHRYCGLVDLTTSGQWIDGQFSSVISRSATEAIAFVPHQEIAPQTNLVIAQGVMLVDVAIGASIGNCLLSSTPSDLWASVEADGEAYIASPLLMAYDGRRPFDFGFPASTVAGTATLSGTGGHMADGNYIYTVVAEYRSSAGILHRSPMAIPVTFGVNSGTGTAKEDFSLIGQYEACKGLDSVGTAEPLRVLLATYRSVAGGSDLHRLTIDPLANAVFNDPTNMSLNAITDTSSDSSVSLSGITLASRPLVYTASELDDFPPPCPTTVHLHKNRLWVVGGDRRTVYWSKDYSANPGTAPGFHPTQILTFDQDIVGLATCDDKLIVFSASSIWYVIGDGPAPNGDGSDYAPNRIQTDVGCVNPRSIVSEPDGVMFLSSRGIYQLSRSLELVWIGKPVRDTLAAYPVITSGILVHALNQIRFTCNKTDGSAGVVLAYDHTRGQWSVFEYADGATASTPIADACLIGETWTFATPGGHFYQEDLTTYLDGGVWVTMDVETNEIYAAGPLEAQRVRRAYLLGEQATACDLTLSIAAGGASTYDQDRAWNSNALGDVGSARVGIHIRRQKAESIRLRVTDASPSSMGATVGTGQGISLSAIAFEVGQKKGLVKRPANARK